MTEPQLPALAAHEIHLFLRVSRPVREWNRLAIAFADLAPPAGRDTASASWVPASIRPALATRYAADPVWEQTSSEVGADLHAHLRRLVSGGDAKLSVAFHASPRTSRLLTKGDLYPADATRDARKDFQLVWVPTDAARRRMAAHGVAETDLLYRVVFADLTCHIFHTGIGFVHATITMAAHQPKQRPLLAVELLEAAVALARLEALGWVGAETNAPPPTRFTMGSVLGGLVTGAATKAPSIDRSFTYSYARFAAPVAPAAADRYALFLARHYTSDYVLCDDAGNVGRVRDFDTVGNVMTLEGAATVVAPDPDTGELPPFLSNFATETLRSHYIPIALLAQHEHAFLIDKTTDSNFWLDPATAGKNEEENRKLRDLTLASLNFRLGFRFSQVSLISMHNAVNHAFREALGLDRMLAELTADVTEAAAFLGEVQRDEAAKQRAAAGDQRAREAAERARAEARWRPIATLGPAFLVGLGVFQVANEFASDWLGNTIATAWWSLGTMAAAVVATYGIQRWLQSRYDDPGPH